MKYYTPESEEFHVGFEYEVLLNSGEWEPLIFQPSDTNFIHRFTEESWFTSEQKSRVKYLDEQDIKELGWTFKDTVVSPFTGKSLHQFEIIKEVGFNTGNKYTLCTTDYPSGILISSMVYGSWGEVYQEMNLAIKNKSELKRIMKQLGI